MEMDKVIVAFESPKSCERVREIIESSGTAACIICRSAAEVKRTVSKHHISTVVCGFKLPDESDRKSTRVNSSHITRSRMPSSA